MIISDLEYLEIGSEETSIVGGLIACVLAPCPYTDFEMKEWKKLLQSTQDEIKTPASTPLASRPPSVKATRTKELHFAG